MKSIKPIALKEAKILSNEEMKHIFGGSGSDSGVTAECTSAACTIVKENASYSGTCTATVTDSSLSCVCRFSGGNLVVTASDSTCFKVTP